MASATPSAALDLLGPADFPDRDSLIGFLVTRCGWSTAKAGAIFERSDRPVRRIAREARQAARPVRRMVASDEVPPAEPTPRDAKRLPATLTMAEAECMPRDYRADPFISAEERELAESWVTSMMATGGVACVANRRSGPRSPRDRVTRARAGRARPGSRGIGPRSRTCRTS